MCAQGENLAELLVRKNHDQSLFFYFHHETNFPKRTIAQSTPNYLMSLCHSHDEKKLADLNAAAAIWPPSRSPDDATSCPSALRLRGSPLSLSDSQGPGTSPADVSESGRLRTKTLAERYLFVNFPLASVSPRFLSPAVALVSEFTL